MFEKIKTLFAKKPIEVTFKSLYEERLTELLKEQERRKQEAERKAKEERNTEAIALTEEQADTLLPFMGTIQGDGDKVADKVSLYRNIRAMFPERFARALAKGSVSVGTTGGCTTLQITFHYNEE